MSNHSFLELFLIAVLVSYRLSTLFVFEDGPFDILLKLRVLVGAYDYGPSGSPVSMLGKLFSCPLCLGIYTSLVIALLMFGIGYESLFYWFAVAGGQSLLYIITKDKF